MQEYNFKTSNAFLYLNAVFASEAKSSFQNISYSRSKMTCLEKTLPRLRS